MKILYLHGFGSSYDPNHEKIQKLETIGGPVFGVSLNYEKGFEHVLEKATNAALNHKVKLVIGTSLGGHLASHVSAQTGILFVALNPLIEPKEILTQWVGNFVDKLGKSHYLTETQIKSYPPFSVDGKGIIFIEDGDEIVKSSRTYDKLSNVYHIERIPGGAHRFTHLESILPLIKDFCISGCKNGSNSL